MTITSFGLIFPSLTALNESSSRSNTRAGPRWRYFDWPESLITQPSGARLPRRMAMPPVGLIASDRPPGPPRAPLLPGRLGRVLHLVADGLAGDGLLAPMEQSSLEQALAHHRHPPRLVHLGRGEVAPRLEVGEHRRLLRDAVEVVDAELHAEVLGGGDEVQHR